MPALEFLRRLAASPPAWTGGRGPQAKVTTCGRGRRAAALRVDLAVRIDDALLVAGWRMGDLSLALRVEPQAPDTPDARHRERLGDEPRQALVATVGGEEGDEPPEVPAWPGDVAGADEAAARARPGPATTRHFVVPRPDAAIHLGRAPEEGAGMGFALLISPCPAGRVVLSWRHAVDGTRGRCTLRVARARWTGEGNAMRLHGTTRLGPAGGAALAALAARWPAFSPRWRAFVARCPSEPAEGLPVAGHLEAACVDPQGACLVTGWLGAGPGTAVWLQDEDGGVHAVSGAPRHLRDDAGRRLRQLGLDVPAETGFAIALHGPRAGARLRMRALTPAGLAGLGSVVLGTLPEHPLDAARRLVDMDPSSPLPAGRIALDAALLAPVLARHAAACELREVEVETCGTPPASPRASLVVPLYARRDLVEHQLLGFAQDAGLLAECEIVYVIDDPRLAADWRAHAQALAQAWDVPMRWVWGGAQRGFAGASNLGARQARGRHLVFLNSDVFPRRPGWVQRLCDALERDASAGAVGPRLLDTDGSLQHAGMGFRWRGDLGLWINHHPGKGLSPAHDPCESAREVDAVTGACLAMRREVFEAVGGWDCGYLVGDFEDSDLCLRLRQRGLRSLYLPEVELTHLERQSMREIGEDRLRRYVTLHNALRHQARWGRELDALRASRTLRAQDGAPLERAA